MALGELDKIVENLVNRGLVSPKMVGRQIGQATIENLKNLGGEISMSQSKLANARASKISDIQKQLTKNMASFNQTVNARNINAKDGFASGNPYAVGMTGATGHAGENQVAIALPGSNGITVQSRHVSDPLAQQVLSASNTNLPTLDTVYAGSQNRVQSLQDLQNFLLKGNKNTEQITGFFNK